MPFRVQFTKNGRHRKVVPLSGYSAESLILPAYVYKDIDFHEVVIIGECVAVGALVICLLFISVDLGGP